MSESESNLPPANVLRARRAQLGAALALGSEFSNSWTVVNSAGATVFEFEYHAHLTSQEWKVKAGSGDQMATMVREEAHMHSTFQIDLASGEHLTLRKASFALVHESWRLEGTAQGDLDLTGDLSSHNFEFTDAQGTAVARASRPWVTMHDVYDIEVKTLDPVVAVCTVVALDCVEHEGR
jgi:uncharacterized protein YxjI